MSDIVERLRNRQLHDMEYVDAMTREAADTIERLRAALKECCAAVAKAALEPKP